MTPQLLLLHLLKSFQLEVFHFVAAIVVAVIAAAAVFAVFAAAVAVVVEVVVVVVVVMVSQRADNCDSGCSTPHRDILGLLNKTRTLLLNI